MKKSMLTTLFVAVLMTFFSSYGWADQDRRDFSYLINDGASYLVLDLAPEKSWAKGKPTLLNENVYLMAVRKKVNMDALPAKFKKWKNRKVEVYKHGKPICQGTIGNFYLMGRFVPHFGTRQQWFGEPEMDISPMPKEAVANSAWDLGTQRNGLRLVAKIKFDKNDKCNTGTWARDASLKKPTIFSKKKIPAELRKSVLSHFRKLKGYRVNQKDYLEMTEKPRPGHWDRYDGAKPKLALFEDSKTGRRFVSVAAKAGMGCGSFDGAFWALYEIKKKNDLTLLTDKENPGAFFIPDVVLDIGNNGSVEFVNDEGIVRKSGATYKQVEDNSFPNYDCPC